jgi:putative phosphoribosyl transferase
MLFNDRRDAGVQLAAALEAYRKQPETMVIGLARGGVVVAHAVAEILSLPLDVVVIRKVGAPFNEELAIGAVDEEGNGFFNEDLIRSLGVTASQLESEVEQQKELAGRRSALYRKNRKSREVHGKTVIVVDDGIATGASMRAVLRSLRKKKPKKIVLAVPVAPPDSLESLSKEADETVCLCTPAAFRAVGQFYKSFEQTTDEEVVRLLS